MSGNIASLFPGGFQALADEPPGAEYLRHGWHLVPMPARSKGPNRPGWNRPENLLAGEAAIPRLNGGNLGLAHVQSGTCALDVDDYPAADEWLAQHGINLTALLTADDAVQISSGRPGRAKLLYRLPAPLATWQVREGGETILEFRCASHDGATMQDVLPPSSHSDGIHHYAWAGSGDWHNPPLAPYALLALWREHAGTPERHTAGEAAPGSVYAPDNTVRELRAALCYLDHDDRAEWVAVGHALRELGDTGRQLWVEWSRRSEKWKATDARKWESFAARGTGHQAVFAKAQRAGWINPLGASAPDPQDEPEPDPEPIPSDESILTEAPPGALGAFVDWYNASAPKPQPMFAVMAALALGSACTARKYVSDNGNFTSLWYLAVGESGCGKEHVRTAIEDAMLAAEVEHRMNPGGYVSGAAVHSVAIDQPAHIALLDEVGRLLAVSASREAGHHLRTAITALMESFGRAHGVMVPARYGTLSLTQAQRQALEQHKVIKPGISLAGMTTPGTLYQSMTLDAVKDGFLGRFLVVETPIGVQTGFRRQAATPPPDALVEWCRLAAAAPAVGNLAELVRRGDVEPHTVTVPIHPRAWAAFDAAEHTIMARRKGAGPLAELYGRTLEIGMRLATLLAVSVDPQRPEITGELAEWGCRYAMECSSRLVVTARDRLAGEGRLDRFIRAILDQVRAAGPEGVTERELKRRSPYRGMSAQERRDVMSTLVDAGQVVLVKVPIPRGYRTAWCAEVVRR